MQLNVNQMAIYIIEVKQEVEVAEQSNTHNFKFAKI